LTDGIPSLLCEFVLALVHVDVHEHVHVENEVVWEGVAIRREWNVSSFGEE
jgi:hypothetical protein